MNNSSTKYVYFVCDTVGKLFQYEDQYQVQIFDNQDNWTGRQYHIDLDLASRRDQLKASQFYI